MTRNAGRWITPALIAVAIDLIFGEPPTSLHPTVAMGNYISRFKHGDTAPAAAFTRGAAITLSGMALSAAAGWLAERALDAAPRVRPFARAILAGAALKPALALRSLLSAARQVECALRADDLAEARRLLAWHLVSRDTTHLTAAEVAGAAIESIAENLSDSFIAPLIAYRVGGLGAAYAYRFANTADAMLGYRTDALEWLGKFPARTDDLLNIIPARATALLIAAAAPAGGGRIGDALGAARRDARPANAAASPNAGWPMAAMAGALDCRLTKRDVYTLHERGVEPDARALRRARHIVTAAAGLGLLCLEATA